MNQSFDTLRCVPGRFRPMGALADNEGVHFALFSRDATRVWLALFDSAGATEPVREFELDSEQYRYGDVWSVYVHGLKAGALYAYRADGPHDPVHGLDFDASQFLLDPRAQAMAGDVPSGSGKCVVVEPFPVDSHRKETVVRSAWRENVIYELHVRGFTKHDSSGVVHKGAYRGLIEKIPYLKELGIRAVELLPVHEKGEHEVGRRNPKTGEELVNYWGYSTIGYFAPAGWLATEPGNQVDEFREMIAAFHEAEMEVYLDVVFNHTSEGNGKGKTLSFRGLGAGIYYQMNWDGSYKDFSGCGNTFNTNHPVVSAFIVDCLRYWAIEMGVDGFRFDLASVLNRDTDGNLHGNSSLVYRIAEDPYLRAVRLIAEPWDVGGAYQVGNFGMPHWAEWNDKFRDDVRRYWKGDEGTRGAFALRLTGSPDLYRDTARSPLNSINFITAHDGYTLRDLVSYSKKHNLANGENNQDGHNNNLGWNCGVEGETDQVKVLALRRQLQRSFIATLFLSLGIPMVTMGDEAGRSQGGNNNAYCQDNAISWFDWTLLEKNRDLLDFFKAMIRFRAQNPVFTRGVFFTGVEILGTGQPDIAWFEPSGEELDWEKSALPMACHIHGEVNAGVDLYLIFNSAAEDVTFVLPPGPWKNRIDTALSNHVFLDVDKALELKGKALNVAAHSLAVLSRPLKRPS